MKLTMLVDNHTLTDRYFLGEPGVCYFIEEGDKRLLFDVGYSGIFLENALKMGLDLRHLDYVVLSHAHLDHTWGLDTLLRLYTESTLEKRDWQRPTLVGHHLVFTTRSVGAVAEIGPAISEAKASRHFDIRLSREPVWLTEQLVFLGQIERTMDFEAQTPLGRLHHQGDESDDYVVDDSALAYRSPDGLVIIVGCSHAGICNIVEQARRVTGEQQVLDIIGGLHLLNPPEEKLSKTIDYIGTLRLSALYACHCTDFRSKVALAQVANVEEAGVGLTIEYA